VDVASAAAVSAANNTHGEIEVATRFSVQAYKVVQIQDACHL